MFKELPKVIGVKEIDALAFSTYKKLCKCILYGLPSESIKTDGVFRSTGFGVGIVLGNLYHGLLERLDDIAGLDSEQAAEGLSGYLDDYINRVEQQFPLNRRSVIGSLRRKKEVNDIYLSVWAKHLEEKGCNGKYLREKELRSNEDNLWGYIDELYIEHGKVRLVDYKTTYNMDKLLSNDNLDQIHFYAYLVSKNFEKYPDEIRLQGILDVSAFIEVDRSHSERIALDMIDTRKVVNQKIRAISNIKELCSPSSEWCCYCKYKIICPSVINRTKSNLLPLDQEVVKVVVETFEHIQEGVLVYGVSDGGGVAKGKAVTVQINLGVDGICTLVPGSALTLANVTLADMKDKVWCSKDTEVYKSAVAYE